MSALRIELEKRADRGAVMRCTRADGSVTWQRHEGRQASFFPRHDLTHYALETELGCGGGFFGLVAAGWPIEDTTGKGARGPLPAEAIVVEHLAGLIELESATGASWSAATIDEQLRVAAPEAAAAAAVAVSEEGLARVRARREELLARWDAMPPGATMALSFDTRGTARPDAAGARRSRTRDHR